MDEIFAELERTLPPIISRAAVPHLTSGLISSGRLANLDYLGLGPRKATLGRKVGYTRGDFIAWMRSRNAEGI
jgi:hypothetical protein